jgi:hypothetical protein
LSSPTGESGFERVLSRFGEATYSVGPVLVLAAAGVRRTH